jgi:hypothetical protein
VVPTGAAAAKGPPRKSAWSSVVPQPMRRLVTPKMIQQLQIIIMLVLCTLVVAFVAWISFEEHARTKAVQVAKQQQLQQQQQQMMMGGPQMGLQQAAPIGPIGPIGPV